MATLTKACLHVSGIRNDYPTSTQLYNIWAGYCSGRIENIFVDFDSINDELPAGSVINSAVIYAPKIYDSAAYVYTLTFTTSLRSGAWGAFTWNTQPTLIAYSALHPTTYWNNNATVSLGVTDLIQYIVDHNVDYHIFKIARQTNTESGTHDGHRFSDTEASWSLYVDYTVPGSAPAAPTDQTVAWTSPTTALVEWTNNPADDAGYESLTLMRSYDGGVYADHVTSLAPDTVSYEATIADGHTYAYKIKAINSVGDATSDATATIGLAYVVTFTDVPEGCSVKVVDGASSVIANRGATSTVYADCHTLSSPYDSVGVYSLPDGGGVKLCEVTTGSPAGGETFDVSGLGADSLRLKAVAGADSSTVDLSPVTYAVDTVTIDLAATGDAALSGATKLTLTGHTASLTLDLTGGVKSAVLDANLSATNFPATVTTDWAPTWSGTGSMTVASVTAVTTRAIAVGKVGYLWWTGTFTVGGTASYGIGVTLPSGWTADSGVVGFPVGSSESLYNGSAYSKGDVLVRDTTHLDVAPAATWTTGTGRKAWGCAVIPLA